MNDGTGCVLFALAFLLSAYQTVCVVQHGIPPAMVPQASAGDGSALDLALGGARTLLSEGFAAKADEYFHGGVRHEQGCPEEAHDHDHEHAHHGNGFAGWVNARVHSAEHRHVTGAKSVELLPWLWAACRADPHNASAYENAAYVLERMLGKAGKAEELLLQGIRENPESAELRFALGELYHAHLHDEAKAETAFAEARARCGKTETLLCLRALGYLGHYAAQRHDLPALRRLRDEAAALSSDHACTRALERLLKQEEAASR